MSDRLRTTKTPSRVFILDDHPLVRRGLGALIRTEPDLRLCGEAEGEAEALAQLAELKPDVAVVDLVLRQGSGLGLLKAIQADLPQTRALVLTMNRDPTYIRRALRLGARGYVLKEDGTDVIIEAVRAVARGVFFLSPSAAACWRPGRQAGGGSVRPEDRLTHRELQILELIGHGFSSAEIAAGLGISKTTERFHQERIRTRLGLSHAAALRRYAYHWVSPPGRKG
jgi:DNA-binding NarL/FixJ family response regulator